MNQALKQQLQAQIIGTGADGLEILASNGALTEPIQVQIDRTANTQPLNIFPTDLVRVSEVQTLKADRRAVAPQDAWFAASYPIPPGSVAEDLVLAVWMPPNGDFTPQYNPPGEEPSTEGHWLVLDGELSANRFISTFYILDDIEYHFVLAEGDWFRAPGVNQTLTSGADLNEPLQSLNSSITLDVICERNDDDVCTDEQRQIFASYFIDTMEDFAGRSVGTYKFPEPYLKEPLLGNADYRVYLLMILHNAANPHEMRTKEVST